MHVSHILLELPDWCLAPSPDLVSSFEQQFSLSLPSDYREFLSTHGGSLANAECLFLEPTPFGEKACVSEFFGFMPSGREGSDVRWNTELIEGAPAVIAIASDLWGGMLWLKCSGSDTGHVYYHDPEQRWTFTDSDFYDRFPSLSPDIENYLELRRAGALPAKSKGYENVYLLGRSFSEFLASLRDSDD